jgi:hypothetical protein
LIGREKELDAVAAAIKAHQVVTLTGVGGVGKTRLTLEVAGRVADSFPDGVWVIELAAVGDPAAVPEAFTAVLGIIQSQPQTSRRCWESPAPLCIATWAQSWRHDRRKSQDCLVYRR